MRNPRFGRIALVLSLAGCVLVTACTSSPNSTQAATATESLSQKLAQAYCARQAACCTAAPAAPDAGAPDGGATIPCPTPGIDAGAGDCLERAQLAADQQLALLGTAYGEALVTINATVVADCVAAYQTRACNAVVNVEQALSDPACANLFIGYIPIGERCDTSVECVAGAYCLAQSTGQHLTSLSGGDTLGVCFPYQGAGKACNTTDDCLPPLTCAATTGVCQ